MNRRLKLLLLVLMIAVLILSASIVSFRLASPAGEQPLPDTQPVGNGNAVSLIEGTNGMWGAVNANGRVLIEPTWDSLRIMSDSVLIARRNDSKNDNIGLIRTNGEQIVPFIYQSIVPVAASNSDLWIASFTENGKQYYHLYHADGSRWSDTAWDSYSYENGALTLQSGECCRKGTLQGQHIEWTEWYTVYPVGLHTLSVALDESELKRLPPAETIADIGEASAAYLRYLFVTKQPPDDALMPQENSETVRTDYRYISTRLVSAEISRIKEIETEDLPAYLVQMQVEYHVTSKSGGIQDDIRTSMLLTLKRSANGALIYTDFRDSQMSAAGTV